MRCCVSPRRVFRVQKRRFSWNWDCTRRSVKCTQGDGDGMLAYLRFRYRLWRSERRGLRISKRKATIFEAAEKRKASKEEIVALQSEVGTAEWFSQIESRKLYSVY